MQEQIRFARLLSTEGFATDRFEDKIGQVLAITQGYPEFRPQGSVRVVGYRDTWGELGKHYELLQD